MSWYTDSTGDAREIDDALFRAWVAAGNPKALYWTPIPARPSAAHRWDGTAWVSQAAAADVQ